MTIVQDNNSSPRSSSGVGDSFNGTPDTRNTTFSPDGARPKSANIMRSSSQLSFTNTSPQEQNARKHGHASAAQERDPFVSPWNGHDTRLSPTASVFSPVMIKVATNPQLCNNPVSTVMSTELGLSRCLELFSETAISTEEVGSYLKVSLIHSVQLTYLH